MTEREYRAHPANSYSTIREFIKDRKKYHKKYILGERVKEDEDESDASILGSLVHMLLSEPDKVEDNFQMALVDKPTGQMKDFVENLYKVTLEATGLNGVVTRPMSSLLEEAFNKTKFDRNGEKVAFKNKELSDVVEKFVGSNAESYYEQLRTSEVRYIINPSDLENSNNIVQGLKTSFNTKGLINQGDEEGVEVHNEYKIFFEIGGVEFKGMIDKLIVSHRKKNIIPLDYKITWMVEDWDTAFRKNGYYIQTASYNEGIKQWAVENGYEEYKIKPLSFIVVDSINYMNPLIYKTDKTHHDCGMNGYVDQYGKYHMGIKKALEDIAWHKKTGIWNISKDNYENGGIVPLRQLV